MTTRNDVARLAGVSTATVSRVVNGSSSVTEETRESLLRAIRELNYVPNVIARSLRTRSSYTLAFVVNDVTNPFFSELYRGICDEANENGYAAFIYQYEDDMEHMSRLLERSVDGIITFLRFSEEILALIRQSKTPVFYIGKEREETEEAGALRFDFAEAGYDMMHYLHRKGHRNIGLIARGTRKFQDIHAGYVRACGELGLPYDERNIAWFDSNKFIVEAGCSAMHELLSRNLGLTAVVCNSDWVAVGAISAAHSAGLKIPEDISIVGFDDLLISSYTTPPLTTVKTEGYEEGRLGCRMLISHLHGKSMPVQDLKGRLVERGSVKDLTHGTEK